MSQHNADSDPQNGVNSILAREVLKVFADKNWSLAQAERNTGMPASTLGRLRSGAANIKSRTILEFAEKVGVDRQRWERIALGLDPGPDDPLSLIGSDVDISSLRRVPFALGQVSASTDMTIPMLEEDTLGTLADVLPGDDARAIRVRGSCMAPAFESGDVILVLPAASATPGDVVIARVGGDALTCKVYRLKQNGVRWLQPLQGEGKIDKGFEILGVAVTRIEPLRRLVA